MKISKTYLDFFDYCLLFELAPEKKVFQLTDKLPPIQIKILLVSEIKIFVRTTLKIRTKAGAKSVRGKPFSPEVLKYRQGHIFSFIALCPSRSLYHRFSPGGLQLKNCLYHVISHPGNPLDIDFQLVFKNRIPSDIGFLPESVIFNWFYLVFFLCKNIK